MSLDMLGTIDSTFQSIPVDQISIIGGAYDGDGIWQEGAETTTPFTATLQPLNDIEIQSLNIGGERITDYRKLYINSGNFLLLSEESYWEFDANNVGVQRYKVIRSDVRIWRNYAKIIVVLIDG